MTTTAEIRQIVERYPAEADRVVLRASGLLASEEGLDELAREIVALVNHEGGRLVLGVSESGHFEGSLELEREAIEEAVGRLRDTRIVPRPEISLEMLGGDEGAIAVVRVERRSGPPHAVARVLTGGGVTGRAYYVREGARTRAVSDERLAWMFRVAGDPAVRIEVGLDLQLADGRLEPASDVPQPAAIARFRPLIDRAPESVRAGADLATRAGALNELAAWAFLAEIEEAARETGLPCDEIPLDDLPVPERRSAFAAEGTGLRAMLDGDRRRGGIAGLLGRKGPGRSFLLPSGSELQVDFLVHQDKGRMTLVHPAFVLALSAEVAGQGGGVGPSLGGGAREGLEWVRLALTLTGSLSWDDRHGATAERLVRLLARRLRSCWDSDRWATTLDPAWLHGLTRV